ncbi:MAG TPA: helix-turn-helix domain-containing protein [Thermoanaerobaculia bacterium]|nr:helix-turn-helix domain-containing protein [Thermoanaerobaculia bacterium]
MAPKLSLEARMTIIELLRRGWSRMAIAETLGVTEGSVRYHERRRREGSSTGWRRWRRRLKGGCRPKPAGGSI